jgi:hypothetical protein
MDKVEVCLDKNLIVSNEKVENFKISDRQPDVKICVLIYCTETLTFSADNCLLLN